jgi:hypothetical protein
MAVTILVFSLYLCISLRPGIFPAAWYLFEACIFPAACIFLRLCILFEALYFL